jgi:imidazole glycerol-phosphate synthase subunit HisF
MLKKRVIFVLFYQDGYFHLSRNFSLQKVGNVNWLMDKFKFLNIGDYIDELIILDVSRKRDFLSSFSKLEKDVKILIEKIFVPLTLGGGIRKIEDVARYFNLGADKVSLNWALKNKPRLITEISNIYGSQAVVASIDVRQMSDGYFAYLDSGKNIFGPLLETTRLVEELGVGELLVNSINQDGTASGFDIEMLLQLQDIEIPIIGAGGAGKPSHFLEALALKNISGVATGNLFNFMGSGFCDLRNELCKKYPNLRRI